LRSEGVSTLGGLDLWYDSVIGRLNRDGRGDNLGNFKAEDLILAIYHTGEYEITSLALTNRYAPEKVAYIERFDPEKVISAIYYDGKNKTYYVKRFQVETTTINKKFVFISEERGSKLILCTTIAGKIIQVNYDVRRKDAKKSIKYGLDDLIDVKGWKAQGNRLSTQKIKSITLLNGEEKTYDVNKPQVKFEKEATKPVKKKKDVKPPVPKPEKPSIVVLKEEKSVESSDKTKTEIPESPEVPPETNIDTPKGNKEETGNDKVDNPTPPDKTEDTTETVAEQVSPDQTKDTTETITEPDPPDKTEEPTETTSDQTEEISPESEGNSEEKDEAFDVGDTIDFDIKKLPDSDQLGLFEKPDEE